LNTRAVSMRRSTAAVHEALHTGTVNQALHTPHALHDPKTRALAAAGIATAAWHQGRNGWWQHRNGGYGWVGPVFWPFAFYDMYDYALWGDGYDDSFWGYGYTDLYAGLFGPYPYDDLTGYAGYLPQSRRATSDAEPRATAPSNDDASDQASLAQMCGDDSRDIAGLPIDAVQAAIQPNDAQRAALDDLAAASAKASQTLKAACPANIALTAPRRLAAMQQRVEAMITAVQTVQPPLQTFYGLLNDEQKAQLNGLAAGQHPAATDTPPPTAQAPAQQSSTQPAPVAQGCAAAQPAQQTGLTNWPSAAIDQSVKPTDAQRTSLDALQSAAAKAADMLKASCTGDDALTPPARLAAVGKRLDTMLLAIKTVQTGLDDFYGTLNDEQKASFDTIGSQQETAALAPSQPPVQPGSPQAGQRRHAHYARHGIRVEHMLRRMIFGFIR
jgi:LTXXQ motif family protein